MRPEPINAPVAAPSEQAPAAPSGGIGKRLDRIGPYQVVSEVVRSGGAALYEARSSNDEPVLIQVAALRAPKDDDDRAARHRYERSIAARTARLIDEPELAVHAHGGTDASDGVRMLFWALPWRGVPLPEASLDAAELHKLALHLCRRLVRRHARDRFEPLLAAPMIWSVDGNGTRELAGVPLAIAPEWLASGFDPSPLAPEERAGGQPTPRGDLWRLGRALLELARSPQSLPGGLASCLQRLAADDAAQRPETAEAALALLESAPHETELPSGVDQDTDEVQIGAPGQAAPRTQEEAKAVLDDWAVAVDHPEHTPAMGTPVGLAGSVAAALAAGAGLAKEGPAVSAPATEVTVLAAAPEAALNGEAEAPRAEVPAADDREPDADATAKIDLTPKAQREGDTLLREPDREAELAKALPRTPEAPVTLAVGPEAVTRELRPRNIGSSTGEVVAYDPSEERTSMDAFSPLSADPNGGPTDAGTMPSALPVPVVLGGSTEPVAVDPALAGATLEVDVLAARAELAHAAMSADHTARIDPAAVAWSAPVLPEGASPWSEVVRPRNANRRAGGDFPGFEGDLPDVVGDRVLAEQRITLPPPPTPKLEPPPPSLGAEIAAAARGFNGRKLAMGIGAFLFVFGFFALVARNTPEPIEALEGLIATPANEVVLDSRPAHALVISEGDGRILGVAPLRFLVPSGAEAVVLIAHEGREPQRLVLPDRGGIVAELLPAPDRSCGIELEAGVAFEGVGFELGTGAAQSIPGAAVVRAKDGQAVTGARIVRCPDVGGAAPKLRLAARRGPVSVRITHPPGASAAFDGEAIGSLPVAHKTDRSFAEVRIDDGNGRAVSRWVPTATEVEVQMPGFETEPPEAIVLPATKVAIATAVVRPKDEASGVDQKKARALELLKQGTQELLSGKTEKARDSLDGCIRIDPRAAECHRQLGQLYRRIEARDQAQEHFRRYLELAPEAPDASLVRRILSQWD